MKSNFYVMIMAGGSGTRLWPMSRCSMPKQFQNLCGQKSLIQETYERFVNIIPKENIFVSLVADILKPAQEQLKNIPKENFIIEPEARNTAPAIGLAATKIFKINPEAIIVATPSDHTIIKVKVFQKVILQALNFLENNSDYLVTMGIKPDRPEIGYGYIKIGKKIPKTPLSIVDQFVEKPDQKTAEKYLKSDKYLWNGGYYFFNAAEILKMYESYAPKMYEVFKKILRDLDTPKENQTLKKEYITLDKKPIDIVLSEKVKKIAVIPADIGWSDIGSWAALYDLLSKNKGGVISRGNHLSYDDKNCLVYAQDKLLATVGLEDIIIVDTKDVTLVCHKDKSQDIKSLLEKIKEQGEDHHL